MANAIFDLEQLYMNAFGSRPYKVPGQSPNTVIEDGVPYNVAKAPPVKAYTKTGATLSTKLEGVEIWLPTRLSGITPTEDFPSGIVDIPYSVIRITGSSTIIRTPLSERRGTVKELYSIDDYRITIKGFFIDKENRLFPEKDLWMLKNLHETGKPFSLSNALTDIYLNADDRVVLTRFDLPEVEGGRKARPFIMEIESDSVFTLEVPKYQTKVIVGPLTAS